MQIHRNRSQTNENGFGLAEALLLLFIIAALSIMGWFFWSNHQAIEKETAENAAQKQLAVSTETRGSLAISEWGVKLPLTEHIQDATYASVDPNIMHLSTKKLTDIMTKVTGCRAGMDNVYIQRTTNPAGLGDSVVRIGDYYYVQYRANEMACMTQPNGYSTVIDVTQQELAASIQKVTAN